MRGRAFGFVAILIVTWTAARIGFALMSDVQGPGGGDVVVLADKRASQIPKSIFDKQTRRMAFGSTFLVAKKVRMLPRKQPVLRRVASFQEGIVERHIEAEPDRPSTDFGPSEVVTSKAVTTFQIGSRQEAAPRRPFKIHAYSFWRQGDSAQGILGNGQYGGSQSAVLMAISLRRFRNESSDSRFALVGRASVSHDRPRERELSAGLRWHPSASAPVQLSLERRFRLERADAFAALVSGGYDGAALPLGFLLDGYGQAGFVTGKAGGGFANIQVHALKPVATLENKAVAAGLGVWGGGQSQIMRLDVGPSLRANLHARSTHLRMDASWRFRIAVDARPGDGPAVTLSTSF